MVSKIAFVTRNYIEPIIDGHIIISNRFIDYVLKDLGLEYVIVSFEESSLPNRYNPANKCVYVLPVLKHVYGYYGIGNYLKTVSLISKIISREEASMVIIGSIPKELALPIKIMCRGTVAPYFFNSPVIFRYPPPLVDYRIRPLYWRLFSRFIGIGFSTSRELSRYLNKLGLRTYWIPPVIPPIDSMFNKRGVRMELGLDADSIVIGYMGHIDPYRGLPLLLKLVKPLRKHGIELTVFPTPTGFTMENKVLLDKLSREGARIVYVDNVVKAYISSDIVILPFTKYYGYTSPPLTLLEALYYNGLVVSTRASVTDEVSELGARIFYLSSGRDPLGTILDIVEDLGSYTSVREWNRSIVLRYFSPDSVRKIFSEIVEELGV